ncbi:MAG: hypothetical protein ABMB14_14655 [Myxococcota bacterium]
MAFVVSLVAGCVGGVAPPTAGAPQVASLRTARGALTWRAVFDDDARAAGAADCSYTRVYDAVEDRSTPWQCPGCEVVLDATVAVSDPDRACYRSIAGEDPPLVERLGWTADRFLRTAGGFGPLADAGARTDTAAGFAVDGGTTGVPVVGGGTVDLFVAGALAVGATVGDPLNGLSPPLDYACGWPRFDPPAYDGPWTVAIGAQLPDAWLRDACDEGVRLHDLAGSYLVVDVSALDCGPCQVMAASAPAFVAELRGLGVRVDTVTVLAPTLDDVFAEATVEQRRLWSDTFEVGAPVLGDRGWGFAMAEAQWPDEVAYPSWFVASPALEVLAVGQGFGGFAPIRSVIVDDWAR